jgi:hypothetical protein
MSAANAFAIGERAIAPASQPVAKKDASERSEASHAIGASGEAASESACRGVRGAKPLD